MAKTKEIMSEEFCGREFQTNLLKRAVNKFKDGVHGVDRHRIDEFFLCGLI